MRVSSSGSDTVPPRLRDAAHTDSDCCLFGQAKVFEVNSPSSEGEV